MGNRQVATTIDDVSLVMYQATYRVQRKRMSRFRIVPSNGDEKKRNNTSFPSPDVLKELARTYMDCEIVGAEQELFKFTPYNTLQFYVPLGRTVRQRATFLAAVAAHSRMKKR